MPTLSFYRAYVEFFLSQFVQRFCADQQAFSKPVERHGLSGVRSEQTRPVILLYPCSVPGQSGDLTSSDSTLFDFCSTGMSSPSLIASSSSIDINLSGDSNVSY